MYLYVSCSCVFLFKSIYKKKRHVMVKNGVWGFVPRKLSKFLHSRISEKTRMTIEVGTSIPL